ncbi:MAG: M2 family metallopeptidase [Gammaproteobacteria bacterium]
MISKTPVTTPMWLAILTAASLCLAACDRQEAAPKSEPEIVVDVAPAAGISAADDSAIEFLARANSEIDALDVEQGAASWVSVTYITDDTALLASRANARAGELMARLIGESAAYQDADLDPDTARMLSLLRRSDYMPSAMSVPSDPEKLLEVAEIQSRMEGLYGAGKYCPDGPESCRTLPQLSQVLATSRDYDTQLDAWAGWRTVSPAMREDYRRFTELTTEGAVELGYADMGDMWRSGYDMSPAEFESEVERLWGQVKPLYEALHCYVRDELSEEYGPDLVPPEGPIPAHLLGNMWSQQWGQIYDLVEPYPGVSNLDVTTALERQDYDAEKITRAGEGFFTSMGMPALPQTFWQRSMLSKPRDREVVCHASAWNMNPAVDDVRIKQCIETTQEQFETVHHELGHIYYYLAYNDLPNLYRKGAHDGFHEGIGDTLNLSMTPGYYARIGLIPAQPESPESVINQQMRLALDKIAFLPFAKLVDQWRWGVFSGEITPDEYNARWWDLRTEYQGIVPPVPRDEQDFDPGAKYHVPGNTPYTRYFLAHILQFQLHKALCEAANHQGPLYNCSIYGSEEAGEILWTMMSYGTSKPWPDILEAAIGTRQMDGSAIIDYFAPLMSWLEEKNTGKTCGW